MGEDSVRCDIFISYRRAGGREYARTLQLALSAAGYGDIFFDFNSLRDGKFNEKILDAINVCKDFILILSLGSMDRCVNEDDWVRTEVLAAIDAGCNIIPVTIDDHGIVFPEELPRKFNSIKRIQQSKLRTDEFFDDSVRRISERLESVKKAAPPDSKGAAGDGFVLTARSDETCELLIEGERYAKIKAGKFTRVTVLKPGEEYRLTFRSLASRKDAIERTYRCPKISKADEISVSFAEYRESRQKDALVQEERRRREREARLADKENRRNALGQYDQRDDLAYDGMTLVLKGDLFGYVNEKGLETIPCQYNRALHFSDGYACVQKEGRWGIIDTLGRTVLPFESEAPSYYSKGIVVICKGGKYGAVSIKGEVIIPLEYENVSQPSDSVILATKGGRKHLLSLDGKDVNGLAFDSVGTTYIRIGLYSDRYESSSRDELKSAAKSRPHQFLEKPFLPSTVQIKSRWGYLDSHGRMTVPCFAEEIVPVYDGFFEYAGRHPALMAKSNGKWGVLDAESGSVIIPMKYDSIEDHWDYFLVGAGIVGILDDDNRGKFEVGQTIGAVDMDGDFFIPMEYNIILELAFSFGETEYEKELYSYFRYVEYGLGINRPTIYCAARIPGKPTLEDLAALRHQIPHHWHHWEDEPYDRILSHDYTLEDEEYKRVKDYIVDYYVVKRTPSSKETIRILHEEYSKGKLVKSLKCGDVCYKQSL